MNAKIKKNSIKAVLYTALILICISWVFPLLFMLLTALRTNEEIRFEGFSFFPKHFTFATFGEVLSNTKSAPVLQWFVNSFNTIFFFCQVRGLEDCCEENCITKIIQKY